MIVIGSSIWGRKRMWATISLEHNNIIRYESAKMDYIRRSNIIKISGKRRSWLNSRTSCLRTRRGIKSKRSSIIIILKGMSDSSVLRKTSGLSVSIDTSSSSVLRRDIEFVSSLKTSVFISYHLRQDVVYLR